MYTTPDVQTLFDCSHQTVKRWCEEFGQFLSPTAQPEKGRPRRFTEADIEVFALIVEMRAAGKMYEDIHAALSAGQRGTPPASPPAERITAIAPTAPAMLAQMQLRIDTLEQELIDERAKRHRAEGREELLMQLLKDAQIRIEELSRGSK
jgi:DNA-binding transcriptional MerR regulator